MGSTLAGAGRFAGAVEPPLAGLLDLLPLLSELTQPISIINDNPVVVVPFIESTQG
jgi:hypothetical protein